MQEEVPGYEVVFAVLAKSDADGVIDHISDAVQDDLGKGFNPLQSAPSAHSLIHVGLVDLGSTQRQH